MTVADERPANTRRAKLRWALVAIGLALAVFVAVMAYQSRNMLPAQRQAPVLRGQTLAGESYDLANASGRPALVYFFATWCKICGASIDNLNRLHRSRDAEKIEIVAVALGWDDPEEVRDYAARHELHMPVVLGEASVAAQWQIQAYPSYYVLDSQHRVARRDIGYSSQLGLWLRPWAVN